MEYTDRPGIVAVYGQEFGEAGINIAGMQIARREAGGAALSVLTVDSPVPTDVLDRVREAIEPRSSSRSTSPRTDRADRRRPSAHPRSAGGVSRATRSSSATSASIEAGSIAATSALATDASSARSAEW